MKSPLTKSMVRDSQLKRKNWARDHPLKTTWLLKVNKDISLNVFKNIIKYTSAHESIRWACSNRYDDVPAKLLLTTKNHHNNTIAFNATYSGWNIHLGNWDWRFCFGSSHNNFNHCWLTSKSVLFFHPFWRLVRILEVDPSTHVIKIIFLYKNGVESYIVTFYI